jgi:hypothetical protein
MIHSASSSPGNVRPETALAAAAHSAPKALRGPSDQIHIDKAATLRSSLQQVPEIRPEVVERARALAVDPAYPSDEIIRTVSAVIVNSPDLSEDNS